MATALLLLLGLFLGGSYQQECGTVRAGATNTFGAHVLLGHGHTKSSPGKLRGNGTSDHARKSRQVCAGGTETGYPNTPGKRGKSRQVQAVPHKASLDKQRQVV